jgi:hypothetical protein
MLNKSTKPNAATNSTDYEAKRSFVNENIKVGDMRDLEVITGLTSNYIYMVLTDRRKSAFIIDTAHQYISERMKLLTAFQNMSLTNP